MQRDGLAPVPRDTPAIILQCQIKTNVALNKLQLAAPA